MRVAIDQTTMPLVRKAAQHIQDLLSAETRHFVKIAGFSSSLHPIYRPDLEDEIAYYELEVIFCHFPKPEEVSSPSVPKPTEQPAPAILSDLIPALATSVPILDYSRFRERIRSLESAPSTITMPLYSQGFVIISTGDHDFPIAHWSSDSQPITRRLQASAQEVGRDISRIYKLDALSYVAEDSSGDIVAQSGQMPIPIETPLEDFERYQGSVSSAIATPRQNPSTGTTEYEVEHTGETTIDYAFRQVSSWEELKSVYPFQFEHHLLSLRMQSEADWQIDSLAEQFGEGLLTREPYSVVLLEPTATFEVVGEGASLLNARRVDHFGSLPTIELLSNEESLEQEKSFSLRITYESGLSEDIPFFLFSADTPSEGF